MIEVAVYHALNAEMRLTIDTVDILLKIVLFTRHYPHLFKVRATELLSNEITRVIFNLH